MLTCLFKKKLILFYLSRQQLTCHVCTPFATSASSVTGLTVGTFLKMILKNQGLT